MQLFAVIPEDLFHVFGGSLKHLYAEVLMVIYDHHRRTPMLIERETLVDAVSEHLERRLEDEWLLAALSSDADEEIAGAQSVAKGGVPQQQDARVVNSRAENDGPEPVPSHFRRPTPRELRERVQRVLRTLEERGWIQFEHHSDYREFVNLADYAVEILRTLDRIRQRQSPEFSRYIYSVYSTLQVAEEEGDALLALATARDQTEQLVTGLKTLNQNIRRYIERVHEERDPREILKLHFEEYQAEVIDKAYHRLKTSDNVYKYRPRIVRRIDAWSAKADWLRQLAQEAVEPGSLDEHGTVLTEEKALAGIHGDLNFIRSAFTGIDEMMDEIDRRNTRYARASYRRLRHILVSSSDTHGQLNALIKELVQMVQSEETDASRHSLLPPPFRPLLRLMSQELLSRDSLYTPRTYSEGHNPDSAAAVTEPDEARREQVRRQHRRRLAKRMTQRRVHELVHQRLGERRRMRLSEWEPLDVDGFLEVVYAAAVGNSITAKYEAHKLDERVTTGGRFDFPDYDLAVKPGADEEAEEL